MDHIASCTLVCVRCERPIGPFGIALCDDCFRSLPVAPPLIHPAQVPAAMFAVVLGLIAVGVAAFVAVVALFG